MNWTPITLEELLSKIYDSEQELEGELFNFWKLIQITPSKWREKKYGDLGGGFWVVAISGSKIIWYNDIEEGFNISGYITWSTIDEYGCEQDELHWAVLKLFNSPKT